MSDLDQELKALLLGERQEAEEPFTQQVRQLVLFEQRARAARRIAWKRFVVEVAASAGVVAVLFILTKLPLTAGAATPLPFGPAAVALLIMGIWTAVAVRPHTHSG